MELIAPITKYYEDDTFRLEAVGVTSEYVNPDVLRSIAEYSVNMPVTYRHVHPASPAKGEILGNVTAANVTTVDGVDTLNITMELLNITELQQNTIEYVKLKDEVDDPIAVSIGFQEFGDVGRPFEWSFTRYPHCESCEVVTMEDEEKLSRIKELEQILDEKKKENDALVAKINTFEDTLNEKIEKEVVSIQSEYETKVEALTKSLESMQQQLIMAEKKPIIQNIVKYEKDEDLIPYYETLDIDALTKRFEKVKAKNPPRIVTQTMESESASSVERKQQLMEEVRTKIKDDPMLSKLIGV